MMQLTAQEQAMLDGKDGPALAVTVGVRVSQALS